ncbi:hypothetical protein [Magnetospirillum sulfuroxidans]|uniref:PilZ domain-containing protein n=1 Tax=Magnetospirillum sulfuroxidans TaxID=611300 RepID=A0ABS5I958_9PROT|nr:hypothetical protein [Magnetospirillum sulfuroxidans]MBR9970975.1 hypothetical protein [Magnetospirillum sulfuroxidans]
MERRRFTRYAGDGLMVMLGGKLLPAADVSLGGVRLTDPGTVERGAVIRVRVIPHQGEVVLLGQAVEVEGRVLATGPAGLRLAFLRTGYSLAKLVVRHARRQSLDGLFMPSGR